METVNLQTISSMLQNLQKDVQFIKNTLSENLELSTTAKKQLTEARKTPRSKYIGHAEVEKEFLK